MPPLKQHSAPVWLRLVLMVVGAGLGVLAGIGLGYAAKPLVSYLFGGTDEWFVAAAMFVGLGFPVVGFFVGLGLGDWLARRMSRRRSERV